MKPDALVEDLTLANGDEITLAWRPSIEASIASDDGCVWTFYADSGHGSEIVVSSVRTVS